MEDYKKKYEQALERAKEQSSKYGIDKVVLKEVFPELKESNDESIRKWLIDDVKDTISSGHMPKEYEYMAKNAISWLEKQGEQKSLNKVEQEDVELTDFESALFSAFSDAWQEYLSGKEVNVAKWAREHSAELLEAAREQKPAWSGEDESNLNSVINLVHGTRDGAWGSCIGERIESWLKSLKERYSWKPSDEQMKALNYVVNLMASSESPMENNYYYNVLKNMRTQLKKLKE